MIAPTSLCRSSELPRAEVRSPAAAARHVRRGHFEVRLSLGVGAVAFARRRSRVALLATQDSDGSMDQDQEVPFVERALEEEKALESTETQEFLKDLGLSEKQLWKVLMFWSLSGDRIPPVSRCRMVSDYLQNDLGLDPQQLARTIADCPEVLEVYSVETLKEKVRFLEVEVGVEEDLAKIIAAYPKIFRIQLTTLRPALEFWLETAKVDPEDLLELLKKSALQIWSRPESLKPKLRFATEVMGRSLKEVLSLKTPFFRLSMPKTVAARHFFAIQHGATGLDLHDLLGVGDEKFCQTIGAEAEEYKEFLQDWPYSEQARALSWLEPKKKSSNRYEKKGREKKGRFEKKGGRFSKRSRDRRPRDRPKDDGFEEELAERFFGAEL